MGLSVKTGTFDLQASTGDQPVTGIGFQGKFGIFWTVGLGAAGTGAAMSLCYGVQGDAAAESGVLAVRAEDASPSSNSACGFRSTALLELYSSATTPTVDVAVTFVSWDADGFTVNVSNAPSSTIRVHYLIFGGTDITDVVRKEFNLSTGVASEDVTGIGFAADLLIFLSARSQDESTASTAYSMLGVCAGVGREAAAGFVITDAAGTMQDTGFRRSGASLLGTFAGTSTSERLRARVTTIGADGFTLTYDTQPDGTDNVIVLAVKGGQWGIFAESQRTGTTGTKSSSGMGFQPTGLFGFSAAKAANTSPERTDAILAIGAYDGTTEHSTCVSDDDGIGTSDSNRRDSATKFLVLSDASGGLAADCDVASLDADGFTLDWTTVADSVAREFYALGFASAEVVSVPRYPAVVFQDPGIL